MTEQENKLVDLATKEFGKLTDAEVKFLSAFARSHPADYATGGDNDPAKANKWGPERILRASLITWLCRNLQVASLIDHQGIAVIGARIEGRINLSNLRIPFPIILDHCFIPEGVYSRQAEMQDIIITHSHTGSIEAGAANVTGSLILQNCNINGRIGLINATIKGNLDLNGSYLINKNKQTITADHLRIEGSILLNDGFKSAGTIQLNGSFIGGNLECADSHIFDVELPDAFMAQSVVIRGNVLMNENFRAEEMVDLRSATINGRLECIGAHFKKTKSAFGLIADGAKIDGGIDFDHAEVIGGLHMAKAKIGLDANFDDAKLLNNDGHSLFLSGNDIEGNLFLRNVESLGEINLAMARVEGNFECDHSRFINQSGRTISAEGLKVSGGIYLRNGFQSVGEISLMNSVIEKDLICSKGNFSEERIDKQALLLENIEIKEKCSFRFAKMSGKVGLTHARISRHLIWIGLESPELTTLDLRYAKIGVIWDDIKSWPSQNNLWLKGLVFDEFDSHSLKDIDIEARIRWIRLQPADRFYPQSYEQLALVYMKEGREEDAKKVFIEKNKDTLLIAQKSCLGIFWHRFLGWTIGYGYKPFHALYWMFAFIVIGWICFGLGNYYELMTPSKIVTYLAHGTVNEKEVLSPDYPKFNSVLDAFIYSVDAFIPVIDLNMKKYWLPNASKGDKWFRYVTLGEVLRIYLIFHIFAGWILTTIFLVGLTGLIKK
ncbi:MAG: hypothetical protein V1766_15595 [Pseudomonadota bacterium]